MGTWLKEALNYSWHDQMLNADGGPNGVHLQLLNLSFFCICLLLRGPSCVRASIEDDFSTSEHVAGISDIAHERQLFDFSGLQCSIFQGSF